MREFVALAISLGKRVSGERDSLVFLFTEEDGIIPAQAVSGYSITSKLMPHLETLRLATVRIVGKAGYRIADALADVTRNPQPVTRELLQAAYITRKLLPFFSPEPELWHLLRNEIAGANTFEVGLPNTSEVRLRRPFISEVLRLLGYDPRLATCAVCDAPVARFAPEDATFYCERHGKTQNTFGLAAPHENYRRA